VPQLGVQNTRYAFRMMPYKSQVSLKVGYSTSLKRFEVALATDRRFEESPLHVVTESRMSGLGVGRFVGFGNDLPYSRDPLYDVRQTQFTSHPALAWTLGPTSEVSLGPIVKYTVTDSLPSRRISEVQPYGFSHFGQAGLQLKFHHDTRGNLSDRGVIVSTTSRSLSPNGLVTEVASSAYPATWDATGAFGRVSALAITYVNIPVLSRPVLALRAGGEKLWGNYPYFEAAFLGGSHSLRTAPRQRYMGDASVHGTAELRVPVTTFAFVLPLNVGALGFVDAGRVFVDGKSPGGWHTGRAAGFWIGAINPGTNVTAMVTNRPERRWLISFGFDY
jgi:hypothetical protein